MKSGVLRFSKIELPSAKGFGTALGIETVASLPGEPSADCVRAHAENASSMLHYIPDLDQAQVRPIGAFAHKLSIDGNKVSVGEPRAQICKSVAIRN